MIAKNPCLRYPFHKFQQNNSPILITITLFSLFITSALATTDSNQQQEQALVNNFWNLGQDLPTYKNLFSSYKDINVTSRLYLKQSSNKQTTISSQSTTLILESDYFKMYTNKIGYKLILDLTPQLVDRIKANLTFIQTSFYFVENSKNYLIEKQVIPFLAHFKHQWREGIQHIMLADLELLQKKEPQVMVLKQMDVYFFQINHQLPFKQNFQGSQAFGVVQVQFAGNKAQQFYYPRPLTNKINTRLKENYLPLKSLQQNLQKGTRYQIKIQLKIASDFFPLVMHTFQTITNQAKIGKLEIQGMNFGSENDLQIAEPYIIRYFKKVLFEGSFWGWVFLIVQTLITLGSKLISFMAILFQIQIFKKAAHYRGASLYCILTFIFIDVVLIVLSFGYLRQGDFLGPLVSLAIGFWKIKKMGRVELSLEYPYVGFDGLQWYEVYRQKDKRSFIQSLGSYLFVMGVLMYPFLFQNYFEGTHKKDQSLTEYTVHRLVLIINQYRFILAILPQLLLNYKLKSCNSYPWKYIIALMLFYSVDNSLLPVQTSVWEGVFFLKEGTMLIDLEIFLAILIFQKLIYGNNLQLLPYQENKNGQQQHRNSQEQKRKQFEQEKKSEGENANINYRNYESSEEQDNYLYQQDRILKFQSQERVQKQNSSSQKSNQNLQQCLQRQNQIQALKKPQNSLILHKEKHE